jgi:beta-glucosidase
VAGADVVQCYVGAPPSTGEPPRQLRGFQRVSLAPGASQQVTFAVTQGDLAYWNSGSWRVAAGTYQISVGDGSDPAHLPLHVTAGVGSADLGANSGPA